MPKTKRYYWVTRRRDWRHHEAWQVLDILRYDRAIVEDHAWYADGRLDAIFVIFSSESEPNFKRLASYGIKALTVQTDKDSVTEFLHCWYRENPAPSKETA